MQETLDPTIPDLEITAEFYRCVPTKIRRKIEKTDTFKLCKSVTPALTEFSKKVEPDFDPIEVRCSYDLFPQATQGNCYDDATAFASATGGSTQDGWIIQCHAGIAWVAIHHRVYAGDDGLVDITPKFGLPAKVVFLPSGSVGDVDERIEIGGGRVAPIVVPFNDTIELNELAEVQRAFRAVGSLSMDVQQLLARYREMTEQYRKSNVQKRPANIRQNRRKKKKRLRQLRKNARNR